MPSDVLIYARLSVSREESVSVRGQLEACRALAAARGWRVVGQFTDDGVSAAKSRTGGPPRLAGGAR